MKKALFAFLALMSFSAVSATTFSIPTDSKAKYTIIDKTLNGSMANHHDHERGTVWDILLTTPV